MEEMINTLSTVVPLEISAKLAIIQSSEEKTYRAGEHILKSGHICRHFYFIKGGLAKLCFQKEEKEFIMNFFSESLMFFTELTSYLTDKPSRFSIVAIEDTELIKIEKNKILKLCNQFHSIEKLFSKVYSLGTINMSNRISELLEENATIRYENFMEKRRDVVHRLSLGEISNYLGITQVSLSRIRAKK